jgi:hypothetical protein
MTNIKVNQNTQNIRRGLGLGLAALLLVTIAISAFPGTASAAAKWYDNAWKFRKEISIVHTLVAHDLEEFPVLISLPEDKNLAANALKYGEDILFTGGDGITKLSHEIEYYLTDNGNLVAWVNVPLLSAEKDTIIYLYYGNPEATGQQDPKGTWNRDFSMVQHLEEVDGGNDSDSTANSNDGKYDGLGQNAKGIIDGGDRFNGTSENVRITHAESLTFARDFTLEAWVAPASVPQYTRRIISKEGEYLLQINGNFVFFVPGVGEVTSTSKPEKDVWTQVTAVYHRAALIMENTLEIYINGKLESTFAAPGALTNTKNDLFLASGDQSLVAEDIRGKHYLNGSLDEVRISDTARPKEWISTSFHNQSKPEAFYKVGEEETPIAAPAVRTDEANPVGMTSATLRGFLSGDGGEATSCCFMWDTQNTFPHPSYTPWVNGLHSGQSFSAPISGLEKATHYYYRAQASNSGGLVSGGILYVLTRPDPPVDGSFTTVSISDTQVDLAWEKGPTAQKTMVRAAEGGYPANVGEGREVYFDVGNTCTDAGLTPGTTYYYRAWSQVSGSQQFSETFSEITVTTLGSGGPGVTVGGDIHKVDKLAIILPYLLTAMVLIGLAVCGGLKVRKNYCRSRSGR